MKIWAITSMRNEQDIARHSIRHWLSQDIDGIIVAENLCVDKTLDILREEASACPPWIKFDIIHDDDPAWYQSKKITKMAHMAAEMGADFIIPCDADELWYSENAGLTVGGALKSNPELPNVISVGMFNHWESSLDDISDTNPFTRIKYRDGVRNPLDKVCYRYNPDWVIDDGNHRMLGNGSRCLESRRVNISIRHFPYRGADHFVSKCVNGAKALRAAKDLPEGVGSHWRGYADAAERGGIEALKQHYTTWFFHKDPVLDGLVLDPAPYGGQP